MQSVQTQQKYAGAKRSHNSTKCDPIHVRVSARTIAPRFPPLLLTKSHVNTSVTTESKILQRLGAGCSLLCRKNGIEMRSLCLFEVFFFQHGEHEDVFTFKVLHAALVPDVSSYELLIPHSSDPRPGLLNPNVPFRSICLTNDIYFS